MSSSLYQKALEFATLAHDGQKRLSGEPFINHPVAVSETLKSWGLDETAIVAGLLHDTIEDGGATEADLITEFGEEVATIVNGVTKITKIHLTGSKNDLFVENLRKMLLVMAKDLRVILVKLADRLHNMQTLQYLSPNKQVENSKETLEIYAPLAERLGMSEVKGTLEDLAFKYAYPNEYKDLVEKTSDIYTKAQKYVEQFKSQLEKLLQLKIPTAKVSVRRKHLYSLFTKLNRPENAGDLSKIHDLVAARVIVQTVEECYVALGAVHGKWHPVPYLGVSDFIAVPKANGYRSIHTKVFGPAGKIVEVQIRSQEMHEQAEMGVAAHWQYAQVKSKSVSDQKIQNVQVSADKLVWVKQLAAWQNEITNSEEYLQALKFDGLQNRNLVFSPIGDVYDLPEGATPVDYAYAVHTSIGHQAKGAKVNGKMVSLSSILKNGDVVEILLDKIPKKPSQEWLSFVVTTRARQEIAKQLKKESA